MLDEVPSGWETAVVDDICEVLDRQRVPLNSEQRSERKGEIPYWGANGVVDHIDDYIFDEPLVLMPEDGGPFSEAENKPICHLVDGKIWVNNHAHILRVNGANREYFYYWFVHRNILPFLKGGGRAKLNQRDLRALPLLLPPLSEQQRIAEILTSVDDTIRATEAVIAQTERVKLGVMEDLLTGGLGSEAIANGEVPDGWENNSIGSMLSKVIDYRGKAPPKSPNGVRLITARNVRNGFFSFEHEEFIDEKQYKTWMNRGLPKANDVLFTTEAPLGNVALFPTSGTYALGQRLLTLQSGPNLCSKYLFQLLQSNFGRAKVQARATGSTAKGIKSKEFVKIEFPFPPVSKQEEIADVLAAFDDEVAANKALLSQTKRLKQGLMSDLLTGKKRVV